ncbi:MAG: hypothetical protein HY321_14860 [Armatimonadetes bacterium]|nr:hypothetical protein [Armatimonadota bacterium]
MNVMVVDKGEGDLFYLCRALEAAGARIINSLTIDEDKVLVHRVDAVVHEWSAFTADAERVQLENLKELDPDLVLAVFARPEDVGALRRRWPRDLVADRRALDERFADRTAEALVREIRARRPAAAVGGRV